MKVYRFSSNSFPPVGCCCRGVHKRMFNFWIYTAQFSIGRSSATRNKKVADEIENITSACAVQYRRSAKSLKLGHTCTRTRIILGRVIYEYYQSNVRFFLFEQAHLRIKVPNQLNFRGSWQQLHACWRILATIKRLLADPGNNYTLVDGSWQQLQACWRILATIASLLVDPGNNCKLVGGSWQQLQACWRILATIGSLLVFKTFKKSIIIPFQIFPLFCIY